ncbi:MAG: photosynthetic complex putative assembly protein PuhB [Pseudomonadota bacterium]
MRNEYRDEIEPIPGLPEEPPEHEKILWQGSPDAKLFAKRVFHVRALSVYFLAIAGFQGVMRILDGGDGSAFGGPGLVLILGAVALGIFGLLALGYAKTTVYTITTERIAMRFGIALPMVVNIPLALVASADMKQYPDGSGDIVLTLEERKRMSYLLMWPNVRPWRFFPSHPALRCLPELKHACDALMKSSPVNEEQPQTSSGATSGTDYAY